MSALFSKNVSLQGQGVKFLLTAAKHEISSKAMDIFSAVSTFSVSTFQAGQFHHFPFFKFEVKNVNFKILGEVKYFRHLNRILPILVSNKASFFFVKS